MQRLSSKLARAARGLESKVNLTIVLFIMLIFVNAKAQPATVSLMSNLPKKGSLTSATLR